MVGHVGRGGGSDSGSGTHNDVMYLLYADCDYEATTYSQDSSTSYLKHNFNQRGAQEKELKLQS